MSEFIMTLNRHIMLQERNYPSATGAFTKLVGDIALAAKLISHHVNRAGLTDILGAAGSENVFGENQQKLDVYSNNAMIKAMSFGGTLCAMVSEENEDWIAVPAEHPRGKYICYFDPLDGSSNIDVNVSIGTIFSIYVRQTPQDQPVTDEDLLQPGNKQVCAGYVIYGSSTMLVYSTGKGVFGFTLDPGVGSFVLSHSDIKAPSKGKIYSLNVANFNYWDEGTQNYVRWALQTERADSGSMTNRYIGSLVADFHRNLLKGGIFLYPGDTKSESSKNGKLRLMYEANPLAFLVEAAGGMASDGWTRIMDKKPVTPHDRTPLVIGSREDVEIAEAFIQGKRKP